jgi:putative ABC transport system substrate-binding protein
MRRIGYLSGSSREAGRQFTEPLIEGLQSFGWIEGRNLVIEWRFADGNAEVLSDLAANLVRAPVEVIVTQTAAAWAAQLQTSRIPIVGVNMATPVESRVIASLARPGGNTRNRQSDE